jgi:hypothetical protein
MKGKASALTLARERILRALEESGGMEFDTLAGAVDLKPGEPEREIATLRHMEKPRAVMRESRKAFRPWH